MSALPEALPLALAAGVYPPALLLLLLLLLKGKHPHSLVLAYYGGAAIVTTGAGLVALAIFNGAGLTAKSSQTASGWTYIVIGLLLLALATWAWRRGAREPDETRGGDSAPRGRIAEWSTRATTSPKRAFVLGLAMFLPSPFYLLAVKNIADSADSTSSEVLAVLISGLAVMVFVEVPVVAMLVRPDGVAAGLDRFHRWLKHNGWNLTAELALVAGLYAITKGISALS
jgi:Sap, sulfolipid-1-addressing protein